MIFYLLFSIITMVSSSVNICSTSDSIAKNLQVNLDPTNPTSGNPFILSLIYDLDEEVTDGELSVKATLSGFPIVNDKYNLCEELSKSDYLCPLDKGSHKMTWNNTVPSGIHGAFSMKESWDFSTRNILCFQYNILI